MRENLRMGASQIKLMAGGGTPSAYDPVDVTRYTSDEMRAAVEAAEDWGTGFLFEPGLNVEQNAFILGLREWFTPAEILKMATHDNADLLVLSGLRRPYQGRLGVVEEGALADLLLVEGDPLRDLELLADPGRNFAVIVTDGRVVKGGN